MIQYTEEHEEIRQYLLGSLSQELQQGVEERLLTERGFLEELLFSEEELIDDYLNDNLSDDNRLHFEQHFLSTPERQQKLRFALALKRYATKSTEQAESEAAITQSPASPIKTTWAERFAGFWNGQRWGLRAAAAALVLIVIGASALWLLRTRSPQTFATLTLTIAANNNRAEGAQASKVSLPLSADALKISLMLPERSTPARRYRAELVNDNGETKSLEIAGQDERSVSVVIPAAQLTRGRYALRLFMTSDDRTEQRISGSYFFNVE